jgi:hypothetical protein
MSACRTIKAFVLLNGESGLRTWTYRLRGPASIDLRWEVLHLLLASAADTAVLLNLANALVVDAHSTKCYKQQLSIYR